ncbi:uncharacterized protein LOC106672956 [Cimex lectularius]|uniref:Uncharacterized protein n=1 Tax=Cimex lectularius TaxID=79782 RepID=A0A8I6SA85_CIMLE|nr:uncharacterized protein LOC106672956 [Cimex lectularius]
MMITVYVTPYIVSMSYLCVLFLAFVLYHLKKTPPRRRKIGTNQMTPGMQKNRPYSTQPSTGRPCTHIRVSSIRRHCQNRPEGGDFPLQEKKQFIRFVGKPKEKPNTISEKALVARLNEVYKEQIRRQRMMRI